MNVETYHLLPDGPWNASEWVASAQGWVPAESRPYCSHGQQQVLP